MNGRYYGAARQGIAARGLNVWLMDYEPLQRQPWHAHDDPSLCALIGGKHRDNYRMGSVNQPARGTLFRPAGEKHASEIGPDGVLLLNVEFTRDWADSNGVSRQALASYGVQDSFWTRWTVLRLLASIASGAEQRTLESLCVELVSESLHSPLEDQALWLQRAIEYMHEAYRENIGLQQVAEQAGVTPVHLARVFRARYRVSVTAFLRALRVEHALKQMMDTGQSAAAASVDAGFSDQAYFARTCASELGVSSKALLRTLRA